MALRLRVLAQFDLMGNGHEVAIVTDDGDAQFTLLRTEHEDGQRFTPILTGKDGTGFLQAALEAAWEAGLRPAGLAQQADTLKATERHLADMRALAFHSIGASKP